MAIEIRTGCLDHGLDDISEMFTSVRKRSLKVALRKSLPPWPAVLTYTAEHGSLLAT